MGVTIQYGDTIRILKGEKLIDVIYAVSSKRIDSRTVELQVVTR